MTTDIQSATLLTIQVGQPRQMTDEGWPELRTGPWTSAIIKENVAGPVWLSRTNVEGDAQGNPAVHGGPDKAALAYSAAHYPLWNAELAREFPYGAFGENLTIDGQDEDSVCIGDTYSIGDDVIVQVASPRSPCWKIARRWQIKDLTARVDDTGRTGWYLRVLREGQLEPGQRITLTDRPHPEWTVTRATDTMLSRRADMTAANALAQLAELADSWKQQLLTPA
ncbi:MAG: MOSC domain-containing protein [Chloroflexota bacterium]